MTTWELPQAVSAVFGALPEAAPHWQPQVVQAVHTNIFFSNKNWVTTVNLFFLSFPMYRSRMTRPLNPQVGDPRSTGVWERSAPSLAAASTRKSKNAPAIDGGVASSDGSWEGSGRPNMVKISSETLYVDPNTIAQDCHPFLEDPSVDADIYSKIDNIRFR